MTRRILVSKLSGRTGRSLLGGAALGAILVCGAGMPAYAQDQSQELSALRAQVQALSDRIATQEAALKQSQSQADAQIKTIPAQVQTAIAAMPKAEAKKSWADDTVVSGRVYSNFSNIDQTSDGVEKAPSGTAFDIKRMYIGIDHKFNDMFSANMTTDFQYSSGVGATELYIKKAYLQAKLSDALTLRLGSADLPWVPFAEDIYGYRYVENVVVDRTKFGTSADWGVHAFGKLADNKVSYAVSVVNGTGYKAPPGNGGAPRTDNLDIEGRVSFTPIEHVTLAIGGYEGKLGKDVTGGAATFHTAKRMNLLAAYVAPKYRVGLEYFTADNWNNVNTVAEDSADGYSVFGSYNMTDKIALFGRYDMVNPKKDLTPDMEDQYFNVGVSYSPTKIVDLSLLYKHDKVEDGSFSTSNGVIGGVTKGEYDEIGVFTQFRF